VDVSLGELEGYLIMGTGKLNVLMEMPTLPMKMIVHFMEKLNF